MAAAIQRCRQLAAAGKKRCVAMVAAATGIQRTTLMRHVNAAKKGKQRQLGSGKPTALSRGVEAQLAAWVLNSCAAFLVPTLLQLRIRAGQVASKVGSPFRNRMPTEKWAREFMRRHDLTVRKVTPMCSSRQRAAADRDMLLAWWAVYQRVLGLPCDLTPGRKPRTYRQVGASRIANADETGLQREVSFSKGVMAVGTKQSSASSPALTGWQRPRPGQTPRQRLQRPRLEQGPAGVGAPRAARTSPSQWPLAAVRSQQQKRASDLDLRLACSTHPNIDRE